MPEVPLVEVEQVGSTAVVFPDRELDGWSGAALVETCTLLVGGGVNDLSVDCADVAFIDCAGVTALVDLTALLRTVAGTAFLVNVPERMRDLLDVLEVDLTAEAMTISLLPERFTKSERPR